MTNCANGSVPYSLWVLSVPPQFESLSDFCRLKGRRTKHRSPLLDQQASRRLLLVHDQYGNIKSAAFPSKTPALNAGLKPQSEHYVAEFEKSSINIDALLLNPQMTHDNFRIDPTTHGLMPKNK